MCVCVRVRVCVCVCVRVCECANVSVNESVSGWWNTNSALVERTWGRDGEMGGREERGDGWKGGNGSMVSVFLFYNERRPALEQGLVNQRAHRYGTPFSAHQARKANPVMSFTVSQRNWPLRSW